MRGVASTYGRSFTFQWHLTIECGHRCEHCYCYDPQTYALEKNPADGQQQRKILDSLDRFYADMEQHHGFTVGRNIVLSGGDPLLHPGCLELIRAATDRGYNLGILGCADTLTDDLVATLRDTNLRSIQLSIDGLPRSHDRFRRSPGSFDRTVARAVALQDDFNVNLMYTVCQQNLPEMAPVVRRLAEAGIRRFDFARVSFLGNAADMEPIPAPEYRAFLEEIHQLEGELAEQGAPLKIGKKDNLWKLLYWEKDLLELPSPGQPISGCPCGFTAFAILADGTLMLCRRFDSVIGHLPEDDVFDLYRNHRLVRRIQDPRRYEGCSICRLKRVCRGCPAVGASLYGQPLRRDPQCWRIVVP